MEKNESRNMTRKTQEIILLMPRFELAPIHWLNDLRDPYQSAKENGNMSRHFKKLIFTHTKS